MSASVVLRHCRRIQGKEFFIVSWRFEIRSYPWDSEQSINPSAILRSCSRRQHGGVSGSSRENIKASHHVFTIVYPSSSSFECRSFILSHDESPFDSTSFDIVSGSACGWVSSLEPKQRAAQARKRPWTQPSDETGKRSRAPYFDYFQPSDYFTVGFH
jgi:hypothetical protein